MLEAQDKALDMAAMHPINMPHPNGRLVRSLSLLDRDIDPLDHFSEQQSIYRIALGDICFLVRRSPQLDKIITLYFIPEYPSNDYARLRPYLSFYGIILSRRAENEGSIVELRAWDNHLRLLSWTDGIKMLGDFDTEELSGYQRDIVHRIRHLNAILVSKRPNLSEREMRKDVGSAVGGRVEFGSLVTC